MDEAQRWARIEEIFHFALERPEEERDGFLTRMCAGDAALEHRVRALLAAEEQAGPFMDAPIARVGGNPDAPDDEKLIGPYRLVRPLGAGGMGEVFLGVQEGEDFRRYAAIKVVREGVGPDFADRFARERGILAQLAHPGIARFLGGGATDDGRPYYVMEHVEGERIDRYADRRVLSVRERVELFRQVCLAVQHAHANLVVHRDLKPGNILVTPEGAPKLLDFGIAKLLTDDREDVTRTGFRLATPQYAAPEQLRGDPVNTATDVYALGVLLYESLSGHRPFSIAQATARAVESEPEAPVLPSVAVTRFGSRVAPDGDEETVTPEDVSGKRRSDPGALRRALKGDLDNIVLKAMRFDPAGRYVSAAAMADDLERYLTGQPVRARADSLGYRASKFVRRNRAATAVGAALAVTLVGASFATLAQNREIRAQSERVSEERDRALEVRGFLLESFGAAGELGVAGDSLTIRQVLDGQAAQIEERYADDAETRAEMYHVLADGYERLGVVEEAELWAERAVELRRSLPVDGADPELARSLGLLGWIYHQRSLLGPAESHLRESLGIWEEIGTDSVGLARALNDLSGVLMTTGALDESEEKAREALSIRHAIYPPSDRAIAITANNLANTLQAKGQPGDALELHEESLKALTAGLGPEHRRTMLARRNVAIMYSVTGDHERAKQTSRELVAIHERRGDTTGEEAARAYGSYGTALAFSGALAESKAPYMRALRLARERLGDHVFTAESLRSLLGLYRAQGRRTEALELAREGVGMYRRLFDGDHARVAEALRVQGSLAVERAEQIGSYREAADMWARLEGEDGPQAVRLAIRLARSLAADDQYAEALQLFEALAGTVPVAYGEEHAYAPAPYLGQAEAHVALGDRSAAESALREARNRMSGAGDVPPNQQWLAEIEGKLSPAG